MKSRKDLFETFKFKEEDKGEPCKGLWFRGYSNFFYSGDRVERKEGVRFLKRKSCPGCEKCGWLWDWIQEELGNFGSKAVVMENIENGALYHLQPGNGSRDWESGVYELDDIEFVKAQEESK